ncbi:GMC family oxidoreductase N-terminal domain-containing protein [Cupriavidus sp. CV2]|uniref:GMC family oxidoreductase n=1 Tax=Cupriavidus ulmosensis TaxID=3065913 RepID=UPI00296AEBFD|nr:GMC family oxidoreductase N-terminal domain-containing protein [Cupriavidus sp. CV2]MDW3682783.1 GMC family oxidoreductase N-terminal domain-containing protein [Cupriavidus sp. CV2]
MREFDYIVVGAGSAGCAVARRLSDQTSNRVLLIEAGDRPSGFWLNTPAGMAKMFSENKFNWSFGTEPIPDANHRRMIWPRGKTLGGSSAINGMVFTRGIRHDYDEWVRQGNPGWGWNDVLPVFQRLEHNSQSGAMVGKGGPQKVSDPAVKSGLLDDFVHAAALSCDVPIAENLSTQGLEGTGMLQASIWKGRRQSAYEAYIRPVERRRNLTIATQAHVTRILIAGDRATGIEVCIDGGLREYSAKREVILCAGAIGSPHLLLLSGIGNSDELRAHRVAPKVQLPGVGKNLQDHYSSQIKVRTSPRASYNRYLTGWRKYVEGARYLFNQSGYLACGATLAGALVKSEPNLEHADLDIGFRPISMTYSPSGQVVVDQLNAFSLSVFVCRPRSRGMVQLASADPLQPPRIHPNYFSDPADMVSHVRGMRICRQILSAEPLASSVHEELLPGLQHGSDEQLADYIRKTGKTSFHASGTCRMGEDPMAVVNARLQVHGMANIRVVDASIMPTVTSANTNAPSIMIGEKGAEMILQDNG